jgi:predicted GNAT superfamily acetyltransferase
MIRSYRPDDAAQVLALNDACQPEVGSLDRAKLDAFASWDSYLKVVDLDGSVAAFLVGLRETAPYASPNYGWFVERFGPRASLAPGTQPGFAYVDRIAVAEQARGQGWGPALYDDFTAWAKRLGAPRLCAEVNVEPPNPRSIRFHDLYGFTQLEEFEPTNSPTYRVVMLSLEL